MVALQSSRSVVQDGWRERLQVRRPGQGNGADCEHTPRPLLLQFDISS
jgi:hypothetical protein